MTKMNRYVSRIFLVAVLTIGGWEPMVANGKWYIVSKVNSNGEIMHSESLARVNLEIAICRLFTLAGNGEPANVLITVRNASRDPVIVSQAVDVELYRKDQNGAESESNSYVATVFVPETMGGLAEPDRLRLAAGQSIELIVNLKEIKWVRSEDSFLDKRDIFDKVPLGNYRMVVVIGVKEVKGSEGRDLMGVNSNSDLLTLSGKTGNFVIASTSDRAK
ncbi:MAG: hypothetical protein ABIZ95_22515 [Pyrinomonadaceae bacterium]